MANLDLATARLQRLTTLVEGWRQSGNISNIERKLALDHLTSLYDELAAAEAPPVPAAPRPAPTPPPPTQAEEPQAPAPQPTPRVEPIEQPAPQPPVAQAQPIVAQPAPQPASIPQAPVQPQAAVPQPPAPTKEASPMVPPPPKPYTPPKQASANNSDAKPLLGEQLGGNRKSLNEQYGTKQDGMNLPRIDSLAKAIGVNDRFLFTKELFGGDRELFEQTIAYLNSCASVNDAIAHIERLGWQPNSPAAKQLISLILRRFA